ncbi:MAG TPA: energy transducer TonB [Pyrinomonadaceae bacterium]|nr:energy transducer TonB [Pyrinomonadaceae bacterium]
MPRPASLILSFSALTVIAVVFLTAAIGQDKSSDVIADKIYSSSQVDKKAVLDKVRWERNAPSPTGCKGAGTVRIGAVLRKSAKVTNVSVIEPGVCAKFSEKAAKAVEHTKFTPARKDGAAVSMYWTFEFNYNCRGECP